MFSDFERKNFQTLANLSKSFWQFWHKVLAWLSNFLSTWTTSVIIISATFFQRTIFQIFSEFFFDRAHKHVNFVPGDFSRERINFEKSSCFIFVFSLSESERKIFGFVEIFGRFYKFAIQRNIWGYFFEYVISRISILWSWAKNFLPPMERLWHGCGSGILRDQTTVIGAFCFKVKVPKFVE